MNSNDYYLDHLKKKVFDMAQAVSKINRRAKNLTCPVCKQIYSECGCSLYEPDGTSHKTAVINYDYFNYNFKSELDDTDDTNDTSDTDDTKLINRDNFSYET